MNRKQVADGEKLAKLRIRRRDAGKSTSRDALALHEDWNFAVKCIERLRAANIKLVKQLEETTAGFNKMAAKLEELDR